MSYLLVFFILGFLILIHELGHFLVARRVGIPVAKFSVGFGQWIWSWKRGETEYGIGWLPLGGYVLPALETEEDYYRIPVGKRVLFALGGPVANLVLAVPLFAVIILATKGFSWYGLLVAPFVATGALLGQILYSITQIFEQHHQLTSVVGIVSQGGSIVAGGLTQALTFTIFLSLNLAIFNLLPIPILDGGKIVLGLAEKIHPQARRLATPLSVAGWIFIMGLFFYATVLDIGRATG